MEYARGRAAQPVNRVGINLAGPTLLAHGRDDQKERWLPRILTAEEIWCQLFSEPGAGSDLASLTTRAVPVDNGWLLSGQKVWTSYRATLGGGSAWRARTRTRPKHRGISYLVVDMETPGIDVRPLVQITGEAEFNEVFLDEVFVPRRPPGGRARSGLDGREHDARARARHVVPVQGAGRARGVSRRPLRAGGRPSRARRTRDRATRSRRRSSSCAFSDCTTGGRSRGWRGVSSRARSRAG